MKYLIILSFLGVFSSCNSNKENPIYELPAHAQSLLTNDSSKTWKLAKRINNGTRMNMGDCFLSHRDTYMSNSTMHNNAGENRDCGETLRAKWSFTKDKSGNYYIKWKSKQLPELLNTDKDSKYFKILTLTDSLMILQFYHAQFSNKKTQITDYYVPEGTVIPDRAFHW